MKLFKNRISILYSILIIAPLLSASFAPSRHVTEERYALDKKESIVIWKGSMQFVPANAHVGNVYVSQGQLIFDKDRLVGGAIEIDMNTITDPVHGSDNDLIRHMKSPDFFDAAKFPISTFTITRVASTKDEKINVTGDLTIKGITHEVTFPASIKVKDGIANAEGKLIFDRTKWDVRYNSAKFFSSLADETISDDIELSVKIVARKI
ncbi:MAG: YceI family protein [Bacteroidota bacterium]